MTGTLSSYVKRYIPDDAVPLEDIAGELVTIYNATIADGKYGRYAVFDCTLSDGSTRTIVTSARLVVEALEGAISDNALPVTARFTKPNRYWVVE